MKGKHMQVLKCDICKTFDRVTRREYNGKSFDLCAGCAFGALDAAVREYCDDLVVLEIERRIEFSKKREAR